MKSVNNSHNWSALSRTMFFLHMISFRKGKVPSGNTLRWWETWTSFCLQPLSHQCPKKLIVIAGQNTCTGGFRKAKGTSYYGKYWTWFYRMNQSKWISTMHAWVMCGGTELAVCHLLSMFSLILQLLHGALVTLLLVLPAAGFLVLLFLCVVPLWIPKAKAISRSLSFIHCMLWMLLAK